MHVTKILQKNKTTLSFEFFPPQTAESQSTLFANIKKLIPLAPGHVSVTYGAGGENSRSYTHQLVVKLHLETGLTIVPHLTCIGSTRHEIYQILEQYDEIGIDNIMALRGDAPRNNPLFNPHTNHFPHAKDLVAFIKKHFPHFEVGVAGFPEGHAETPNRLQELRYLKEKVDAGASYICTQLFFQNEYYYDYLERCEVQGIHVPIIAGIMPISSKRNLVRMAELALGTNIPAPLLKSVGRAPTDEYVKEVGQHWALEQVRDLIHHGCVGIHFYTLNQAQTTMAICKGLGIRNSHDLNKNCLFPNEESL